MGEEGKGDPRTPWIRPCAQGTQAQRDGAHIRDEWESREEILWKRSLSMILCLNFMFQIFTFVLA